MYCTISTRALKSLGAGGLHALFFVPIMVASRLERPSRDNKGIAPAAMAQEAPLNKSTFVFLLINSFCIQRHLPATRRLFMPSILTLIVRPPQAAGPERQLLFSSFPASLACHYAQFNREGFIQLRCSAVASEHLDGVQSTRIIEAGPSREGF